VDVLHCHDWQPRWLRCSCASRSASAAWSVTSRTVLTFAQPVVSRHLSAAGVCANEFARGVFRAGRPGILRAAQFPQRAGLTFPITCLRPVRRPRARCLAPIGVRARWACWRAGAAISKACSRDWIRPNGNPATDTDLPEPFDARATRWQARCRGGPVQSLGFLHSSNPGAIVAAHLPLLGGRMAW